MPVINYTNSNTLPENLGENVEVTLSNGEVLTAFWDGLQWWVALPESDNNVPVNNSFVVSWRKP